MSIDRITPNQLLQALAPAQRSQRAGAAEETAGNASTLATDTIELGGRALDGSFLHALDPDRVAALLAD